MITAERLRELLDYDPTTGIFTWKRSPHPNATRVRIGSVAGTIRENGYRIISIDGRNYRAHRLAWLWVKGAWPNGDLDHKDNCRDHNWMENLRPATDTQNLGNARRPRHNASGFKGVTFHSKLGKWRARIQYNSKQIHLGRFDTPEEAHIAYVAAAERLFGEFARGE